MTRCQTTLGDCKLLLMGALLVAGSFPPAAAQAPPSDFSIDQLMSSNRGNSDHPATSRVNSIEPPEFLPLLSVSSRRAPAPPGPNSGDVSSATPASRPKGNVILAAAEGPGPIGDVPHAEIDMLKYTEPSFPEPSELRTIGLRLVLATGGVLAACVVSLLIGKRFLGAGSIARAGRGKMCLLETLSLSNRCHLQLIQVDGHKLLVGLDAGGLKTVLPLQDPFIETLDSLQSVANGDGHGQEQTGDSAPSAHDHVGARSRSVFQHSLLERSELKRKLPS